jgi:hypothetical protein
VAAMTKNESVLLALESIKKVDVHAVAMALRLALAKMAYVVDHVLHVERNSPSERGP